MRSRDFRVSTGNKTATRPHLPQDFGTIIIVLHGVLYKAEAINVTNKRVTICSEEVKTTDCLLVWTLWDKKKLLLSFITRSYWQNTVFFFCETHLKCNTHFSGHKLLHCGEHHGIADLLPLTVSLHFPIQSRRLTGFGVSVIRSNSVNLQHPSRINKLPGHHNSSVLAWNTCLP